MPTYETKEIRLGPKFSFVVEACLVNFLFSLLNLYLENDLENNPKKSVIGVNELVNSTAKYWIISNSISTQKRS